MTNEAPERIYAKYSEAEPYNGKRGLIIDNEPFEGSQEFVRRPRVKPLVWTNKNVAHGYPDEAIDCMGGCWTRWWIDGKEYFKAPEDEQQTRYGRQGSADTEYERRILGALL